MPDRTRILPAGLLAIAATAMCVAAQDLPPLQDPLPWPGQGVGLGSDLDMDVTLPLATGTADAIGVADEGSLPEETAGETAAAVPAPAWLPELSAAADMSECSRDLLRSRLATAVPEEDILAAMALEAELLTLCRERQELVLSLHEVENLLAELQHAGTQEADETAAVVLSLLDQFVEPDGPPIEIDEEETPPPPAEPAAGPSAEEATAEEPQVALAWFSILGVKGALRAGITDGTQIWWVTEGTELPGGVTVATITGKPPKVIVAGDEAATLPWSQRPGGL